MNRTAVPVDQWTRRMAVRALVAGSGVVASGAEQPPRRIRLIISSAMVEGLNENDAKAAMKAWAAALIGGTALELEKDYPRILPRQQLAEAIRLGQVEAMAMTLREYLPVAGMIVPDELIVSESSTRGGWRYLILTHVDSGIENLAGLKGRAVLLWKSSKTYLAREWLETELHAAELAPAESHFSQVGESAKASRGVVLPVFFRQADGCLVGASAFDELCELNPQLRKKLKPVAASPNLVTNFFAFHKEFAAAPRKAFLDKVLGLSQTAAGQQALTLFQTPKLVAGNTALLTEAIQVLQRYERLPRGWGRAR